MARTHLPAAALAVLLTVAGTAIIQAQGQAAPAAKPSAIPLKITITISRYQGEKKTSSLPYTLSVSVDSSRGTAGTGQTNLRNGTRVPITSTTTSGGTPTPTITYQDVGTSIDGIVNAPDEAGRFKLQVTIDESSVYDETGGKGVIQMGRPTLRSFRTTGSLMLKHGQSAEMSNTPDKITGESVRVDVALAVVK